MTIYSKEKYKEFLKYKQPKKKHFEQNKELASEMMKEFWWAKSYNEAFYCLISEINEAPLCENCNTEIKKYSSRKYNMFCANKKCIYNKNRMPLNDPKIQNKCRETLKKKYGVDNASQLDFVKEKKKKTTLKNYGVDHPLKSEEIKEKKKKTNLEVYGVEYPTQSFEVQEKTKKTNLKKYGVEYQISSKQTREKTTETVINKYNVENVFQSEEIKEIIKNTCKEKYNTDHPMQNLEVQQKAKDKWIENYGVDHPLKSEEIKEKRKNNYYEKYGIYHHMQDPNIFSKFYKKKIYIDLNGKEHFVQGYEDLAIKYCDSIGKKLISDSNIIGNIKYILDGIEHRYYPDLKLEDGTYIEVKSEYTLSRSIEKMKLVYEQNPEKIIEIWVFDEKTDKPIKIIKNKKELLNE